MTNEIAAVLGILIAAVVLFVSGRVRVDLVALLVVTTLAISGILTPEQALAGFSSPAVLLVAAMFVVSAALARTGVVEWLGKQLLRAGRSESRLIVALMLTAAALSAVMTNLGVIALLLPAAIGLARRTGVPPSRLLMPLILGAHLGGMTTLLGTPPNIVVSDMLREQGHQPLGVLDFTIPGVLAVLLGTAFMAGWGRHLLPRRDPTREEDEGGAIRGAVDLEERLFHIRLPARSRLHGRPLADSRIGSALGLQVLAIQREGDRELSPSPSTELRSGDRLLVQGSPDFLRELRGGRHLVLEQDRETRARLVSAGIEVGEARVAADSRLDGASLLESDFRQRLGVIVIGIRRGTRIFRTGLHDIVLKAGDALLLQGPRARLEEIPAEAELGTFEWLDVEEVLRRYRLEERFVTLRVTESSMLVGRSLHESRLGDAAGVTVLGIIRGRETRLLPAPETRFEAGDVLLAKADPGDLAILRGLQRLEIEDTGPPDLHDLESPRVGLAEVVVAPDSSLAGQTLRSAHFRERYGLDVLAVWRAGEAYRTNLRDIELKLGDALLVFGPRDKLRPLARDRAFIVLSGLGKDPPEVTKAPLAAGLLTAGVATAVAGWLTVEVALLTAALAMVLTRCVALDDAYRSIQWKVLILIGGMIPLGTAFEVSGAGVLLGEILATTGGQFGPRPALAILCLVTAISVQVMPPVAMAVLLAPIGISLALATGLSPQAAMLAIALSSAPVASPVAHPGNVLVMGPGGYAYADYLKVGVPVTLLFVAVVVGLAPLLFPA